MTSIRYWIYRYLWDSLDWLFPPYCAGCEAFGFRWCRTCHSKVELLGEAICPICGMPQNNSFVCQVCKNDLPFYNASKAWAFYKEPLRSAVHRLKYKGDMALGEYFSRYLIEIFIRTGWHVDLILPVPLFKARYAERGFNQAFLFAKPLSLFVDVPCIPDLLERKHETRSQVGLSKEERISNVLDAFKVVKDCSKFRSVLIVDDVMTTGATLNACAKALKEAGVLSVYGLTLARAGITLNDDFMII